MSGQNSPLAPAPDPEPPRRSAAARRRAATPRQLPLAITLLILACAVIEGALVAADLGIWLGPNLRPAAFSLGAFYPGLLRGSEPLYPGQPLAMFFTYAFLHGGPVHFALNMLALYLFGTVIIRRIGSARFLIAYTASALGGAWAFFLLGDGITPMVGASGALFGLLGVWSCWDYLDKRFHRATIWEIIRPLVYLLVYNLAFMALMQGQIAWQTHLGGFLVGWALALYWGRPLYRRIR